MPAPVQEGDAVLADRLAATAHQVVADVLQVLRS
jgi:hypothetical protein